jgi:catechol 2,3-dioxygenase-like lactoylglutathione lyase family enzyme
MRFTFQFATAQAVRRRLERRDVLAYSWPQSEDPMAKIKHIAIATQDPEGTARFYTDVFGMKQIGRIDSPNVLGYFLSDGDINFAILKFKSDAAAGEERGKDWSGIHHFGFQVESLEAIAERLAQVGSQRRDDINNALGLGRTAQRNANVEVKYTGARRRHGRRLRDRLGRHPDLQPR